MIESNEDRAKLLERLAKVKAQAEGEAAVGNVEAAKNMSALFQKILAQHRITMAEVDASGGKPTEEMLEHWVRMGSHEGLKDKKKRSDWAEVLARIVADAHGCRVVVVTGSNTLVFVGLKTSVLVCEYLLVTLIRTANVASLKAYDKFYNSLMKSGDTYLAKGYQHSWLMGFAAEIKERFAKELAGDAQIGSAMVLFKKDLAEVDEWLKENMKTHKVSGLTKWTGNAQGSRDGRDFAKTVNLKNNAVASGDRRQGLTG